MRSRLALHEAGLKSEAMPYQRFHFWHRELPKAFGTKSSRRPGPLRKLPIGDFPPKWASFAFKMAILRYLMLELYKELSKTVLVLFMKLAEDLADLKKKG